MKGKRIQYLDLLKAIAIFLVVFCHFVLLSETVAANIFMSACWMAVPIFFMVNGALLFARPLNLKKHIKKIIGIYLALAVWKLIYMLVIPPATGTALTDTDIWQVLNYLFFFGELPGIINGHLWFIEALLAVYIMFPLFRLLWDYEISGIQKTEETASADVMSTTPQKGGNSASHSLTWVFTILTLLCTNGFHSLGILGNMLRQAGLPYGLNFDSMAAFQPFGKYGNMLGFFLLGALLADKTEPLFGKLRWQRLFGFGILTGGLAALWGVKCFLSNQAAWDGILLQEGYRHVPVIFMAAGLFLLCKDVTIKPKWLDVTVQALSRRTLGIFYLHWIFGWLLVNPLTGFLVSHGISFGIGANILKNIVLMVPAFFVTVLLEKLPGIRKLISVG